jgi:hypothetical protein
MHLAPLKQFAQNVAHLLADAKQAHGAAFSCFLAAHQTLSSV